MGVAAQGMTADPVAQRLTAGRSRELLATDGFTAEEIASILDAVPVATHNQRGLGTLHLGLPENCDADVDATELLAIVEDSMSSEIYELMKRSDEGAVVETAHGRPRSVGGLRPRGVAGRDRALRRPAATTCSCRRARRTPSRSTSTTSSRSGSGSSASCAKNGIAERHTTMREWLSAAG